MSLSTLAAWLLFLLSSPGDAATGATMFLVNTTVQDAYMQFAEAQAACNDLGATLASIHSHAQYNESVELCNSVTHSGTKSKGCWYDSLQNLPSIQMYLIWHC